MRNRVRQIKACSHIGERQDRGVFNHCATVDFRMPLDGTAPRNHGARTNARHGTDESRCNHTRAFFHLCIGGNPYAGPDLFPCRAGLRLARKNIDGKLPQVAGTAKRFR